MGWLAAFQAAAQIVLAVIKSKSDGKLTQEKVDAALKHLEPLKPPKE